MTTTASLITLGVILGIIAFFLLIFYLFNWYVKQKDLIKNGEEITNQLKPGYEKNVFYRINSVKNNAPFNKSFAINLSKINNNIKSDQKNNIIINISEEAMNNLALKKGQTFKIKKGLIKFF